MKLANQIVLSDMFAFVQTITEGETKYFVTFIKHFLLLGKFIWNLYPTYNVKAEKNK